MSIKTEKKLSKTTVRIIVALYAVVVLTLILLSASNYPVQWRDQVNKERERYAEVYAQAIEYYYLDHDGTLPRMPENGTAMIANTDACTASCPALHAELACMNMQPDLVPGYIGELLRDPLVASDVSTGFYLTSESGRIVVGACNTFFGAEVKRLFAFSKSAVPPN